MTMKRRQTLSALSHRQSPRHMQARYSLMPSRNENLIPGRMKRDKNVRQSINIYKIPNSMAINEYTRRSSSRLSTYEHPSSSAKKDIRPIRTKQWVSKAKETLIRFLVITGLPDVSKTSLKSPSAKDFKRIFMYLYQFIDQYYVFGEKDFEDQVIQLIKGLRYPYPDTITKSHLKSVGSTFTWPMILGVLTWMVELITAKETLLQYVENYVRKSESNGIFEMISDIYKTFDENEYRQRVTEVSRNLEIKTAEFHEESQKLDQEIEKLEKELELLTTKESPLVSAKQANEQLLQDQNILNIELKDIKQVEQQFIDQVNALEEDFKVYEKQLVVLSGEKENLDQEVVRRGISAIEIEKSQADRDQLILQQKSVDNLFEEKRRAVGEFEINLRKLIDDVESNASDYNSRLTALNVSKYVMRNVHYQNKTLEILLPICPAETEKLYESIKKDTMPLLTQLRKSFKDQSNAVHESYIKLQNRYTQVNELKTELMEERDSKKKEFEQAKKYINDSREKLKREADAQDNEVNNMEKRILQIEKKIEEKSKTWKHKKNKVMMENDELVRIYNEMKDRNSRDIIKLLQDVMRIKNTVSNRLEDLKLLALEALNEAQE